ncbi:MAG: IS481 family transposase [Holosporales bacterium]
MGSVLHANAKTTPRIREEIQNSKESIAALAKRLSLNPKTVLKWRQRRGSVVDKRSGPIKPKSVLSTTDEQIICEFRRVTKLSLDDVFIALRGKIKALTRSNLHRCLKRNNLNVLPKEPSDPKQKKFFKDYPPGFIHIDITEVRTEEGKLYLFVAIDRCTKYVYAEIYTQMTTENACLFLKNLIEHYPAKITKILTDNGAQFTYKLLAEHLQPKRTHPFDVICQQNNIEHRLTKFRHPWTNGQVEVTNKIIKQYTTKTYHYETTEELKHHLMVFLLFYNHQRPLKSLKYKTPFDILKEFYEKEPALFYSNLCHKIMGLNTFFLTSDF